MLTVDRGTSEHATGVLSEFEPLNQLGWSPETKQYQIKRPPIAQGSSSERRPGERVPWLAVRLGFHVSVVECSRQPYVMSSAAVNA